MKLRTSILFLSSMLLAFASTEAAEPAGFPEGYSTEAARDMSTQTSNASSGWRLSAGGQWRQIGRVSFRGGSRAGLGNLPAVPNGGKAQSGYTNGYVRPDSAGGAETWNWGYTDAAQVQGNFLVLNGNLPTGARTRTTTQSYQTDWQDDLANAGFFVLLESPTLAGWQHLTLSAALGYGFAMDQSRQDRLAFRAERSSFQLPGGGADHYRISGESSLPSAPYSGTFTGPGQMISRTPTFRLGGGGGKHLGTEVFTSQLSQSLEVQLHTFSLGPRAGVNFANLRMLAGLGFALNVAAWNAESRETLRSDQRGTVKVWRDEASGTDLLPGAYAELGAEWTLKRNWYLTGGLRFDWSQSLEGGLGGAEWDVALGGWTASLGAGFRF
jgi:hypothetical protein